jgi:hypothetical protein
MGGNPANSLVMRETLKTFHGYSKTKVCFIHSKALDRYKTAEGSLANIALKQFDWKEKKHETVKLLSYLFRGGGDDIDRAARRMPGRSRT